MASSRWLCLFMFLASWPVLGSAQAPPLACGYQDTFLNATLQCAAGCTGGSTGMGQVDTQGWNSSSAISGSNAIYTYRQVAHSSQYQ
jgi:hypothetical protein